MSDLIEEALSLRSKTWERLWEWFSGVDFDTYKRIISNGLYLVLTTDRAEEVKRILSALNLELECSACKEIVVEVLPDGLVRNSSFWGASSPKNMKIELFLSNIIIYLKEERMLSRENILYMVNFTLSHEFYHLRFTPDAITKYAAKRILRSNEISKLGKLIKSKCRWGSSLVEEFLRAFSAKLSNYVVNMLQDVYANEAAFYDLYQMGLRNRNLKERILGNMVTKYFLRLISEVEVKVIIHTKNHTKVVESSQYYDYFIDYSLIGKLCELSEIESIDNKVENLARTYLQFFISDKACIREVLNLLDIGELLGGVSISVETYLNKCFPKHTATLYDAIQERTTLPQKASTIDLRALSLEHEMEDIYYENVLRKLRGFRARLLLRPERVITAELSRGFNAPYYKRIGRRYYPLSESLPEGVKTFVPYRKRVYGFTKVKLLVPEVDDDCIDEIVQGVEEYLKRYGIEYERGKPEELLNIRRNVTDNAIIYIGPSGYCKDHLKEKRMKRLKRLLRDRFMIILTDDDFLQCPYDYLVPSRVICLYPYLSRTHSS